ncbi:MAG TPA: hypothetical protein VHE11_09220 [Steroidobacteraceae bacterium]|nr:hypothetical protein [Steroidobacteraceae bacterium]
MPDSAPPPLAAYRGAVRIRRAASSLTLSGSAADSPHEILLLTFIDPECADLPDSLTAATVRALEQHRYRISSASGDWTLEATSLHIHRDIGIDFYSAIPPRPAPLKKRLFWRVVLTLAATHTGKRLLLSLRQK